LVRSQEVQCDPSETETQLADVQAELLEAQANYAQAVQTIVELKDQIRTLSSQQQTWNANEAELEVEVRVLREAKNRAEMARRLWSENAARLAAERLAAETTGF
jgi:chromosome segregation ATPase